MKLAFMSSVCPKLSLGELLSAGERHGYEGIEFRPQWHQAHGVELTASAAQRRDAGKALADSPLAACCLSPGVKFCSPDAAERQAQAEALRQYIDLAAQTGIERVRVFGDPLGGAGRGVRSASYQAQAEHLAAAAEAAGEAGVTLVLETHGNFRAADAGEVLFRAGYPPALRINWHLAHCLRHGEGVDEAYRHVKGLVGHCHFDLSEEPVAGSELPRQVELLAAEGFGGFFSVEVIDPDDGEAVLARHAGWWRELPGRANGA